ncbi:MAG: DNA polymerase I [Clostridia bacterium]
MNKIILLDSNSLVNRAFYAMPYMSTKDGTPTNAVYGFATMLLRLIADHKPTHIAAVFDLPAPTFRHLMYDNYKATRKPMPDDLAVQMPILRQLLEAMNIKILQLEGYEADDIIGTIAKRFDDETIIVSGDRDVLQLIDSTTKIFNTKRGVTDIRVYDLERLREEGFTPKQVIEYKALAGDASDNIPGAKGVGDKTATGLLAQYGSVDGVYENIDQIKGKLRERLIEGKENVYISQKLAEINTDVPLPCELDCMEFTGEYAANFYGLLTKLEFKSLLSKFSYLEDIADNTPKEKQPLKIEGVEIKSIEVLEKILAESHTAIAVDIGESISFAFDDKRQYSVTTGESLIDFGIGFDEAILAFKGVFSSPNIKKVLFDVKSLMRTLTPYGIDVVMPYEDLLLKSYLVDSTNIPKSLGDILPEGKFLASESFLANKELDQKLKSLELDGLYREIELPLIKVLFDMESAGFNIDTAVLDELSEKYVVEIHTLESAIYETAGETFNINSPKQLEKILFEKLGLRHGKKTKTGYSVAADVLEELEHPIIRLILRYRKLVKLQSTYINGMRAVIHPSTGKVHTIFKQCLTATGRLSSTEPNLQNIPIRTEEGREVRKMFIPNKGNILISADYSQIELRLLAHFSGDTVLTNAYRNNKDIHTITAAKIFDTPEHQVTKDMRRDAKAVNFGIIYGISAFGLSNNIGITPYQAKLFQDKYFETYPAVKEYMAANVSLALQNGYIRTLKGRIRHFPEFRSKNHNIRNFGERAAMNMPLQGSASDIIKIAMLKVDKALKEGGYKTKLILQVHDELILDAPKEEAADVKKLLINAMENAVILNVPLPVDAKLGANWYEAE